MLQCSSCAWPQIDVNDCLLAKRCNTLQDASGQQPRGATHSGAQRTLWQPQVPNQGVVPAELDHAHVPFEHLSHTVAGGTLWVNTQATSVLSLLQEPFVELMKGSLNTFLNAFTYPDRTCYPVCATRYAPVAQSLPAVLGSLLSTLHTGA